MTSVASRAQASAGTPGAGSGSLALQDVDKQKSIERYVRMSISNHAEHQIMSQEQASPAMQAYESEDDPLSALFPQMPDVSQGDGINYSQVDPHLLSSGGTSSMTGMGAVFPPTSSTSYDQPPTTSTPLLPSSGSLINAGASSSGAMGPVLSTAASTTFEENAATVQRILEEMQRMNPQPIHRKDHSYNFPQGMFPTEVDLEGSQQAYQHLVHGLDNPSDFLKMFDQIEADPLRQQTIFGDLNFEPFD